MEPRPRPREIKPRGDGLRTCQQWTPSEEVDSPAQGVVVVVALDTVTRLDSTRSIFLPFTLLTSQTVLRPISPLGVDEGGKRKRSKLQEAERRLDPSSMNLELALPLVLLG